jgi:hypothetical protein
MGKSIVVAAVVVMAVLIGHVECFRSAGNLGLKTVGNGRLCPQLRRSVGVFQNLKSQVKFDCLFISPKCEADVLNSLEIYP